MKSRFTTLICLIVNIHIVHAQSQSKFFSEDSLKSTVEFLAGDQLKGRGNFTPELEKAALFISKEFERAGLQTSGGAQSYFFPFIVSPKKETWEIVTQGEKVIKPKKYYFNSIYTFPPPLSTSDFTIVPLGTVPTSHLVSTANRYIDSITGPILFTVQSAQKAKFSFIQKHATALHRPRHTLLMIVTDEERPNVGVAFNSKVKHKTLFNVMGALPGRRLANEIILISSHYDHIGVNESRGDTIFNGANDNASGTAAMLAFSKYFAENKNNERTIVFVAFAGEELGLNGSLAMADNFDCSNVKAMFNLEMLGKPGEEGKESLIITEDGNSDLKQIIRKYCTSIKIADDRNREEDLYTRSDNYPFALKKVPAHTFMCFSEKDPTYHKPTDEVKTLDFENMSLLVKGLLPGIEAIVSGSETPKH